MKLKIDRELCIGCNACATVAPELIEMDDDQLATVIVESVSEEQVGSAKEAIESCPVDAVYEEGEEAE